jgi:hypothetical protein
VQGGPFENVAKLNHFGTTARNHSLIKEDLKRELNSGNDCYDSAQDLLCSCLLPESLKNLNIRNYNFSAVWFGCETWSLTLKDV